MAVAAQRVAAQRPCYDVTGAVRVSSAGASAFAGVPSPIIAPCAGRLTMNQRPPLTRIMIFSPSRTTLFSSQAFDLAENFASDSHLEEDGLVLGDEQNLETVGRSSVPPLVWPHNLTVLPVRSCLIAGVLPGVAASGNGRPRFSAFLSPRRTTATASIATKPATHATAEAVTHVYCRKWICNEPGSK